MKCTAIVIYLLIILTNSLSAQNMLNGLMDEYQFTKMRDGTYSRYNLKMSEIQGTPYLNQEFSPGKIVTKKGAIYTDIPLRYNAYSDDLEFRKDNDTYNIEPKTIVKRAEFGGVIFACMQYDLNDKTQNGLFEILTEGKATLLVRYSVRFSDKEEAKGYSDPKPARFEEAQKNHFISIDGAPAKLITNKKRLLELFGTQKGEMESYISKNKIAVKGDDNLTKIVAYYNSL
jgi:hypothetical protein